MHLVYLKDSVFTVVEKNTTLPESCHVTEKMAYTRITYGGTYMATVITQDSPTQPIVPSYPVGYIVATGVTLGVLFWGLNAWVSYYVVDQLLCQSSNTLSACLNSTSLSSALSAIVVGVIGIVLLVRLRIRQPILVAIASAIVLWTLGNWTDGLGWGEVMIYTVVLYTLTYGLFTWITRYKNVLPVFVIIILSIAIIRAVVSA
jgi:hypothetical protein